MHMINIFRSFFFLLLAEASLILLSCTGHEAGHHVNPAVRTTAPGSAPAIAPGIAARPKHLNKPHSHFQDILSIRLPAAVFYYPDSLQLEKVKSILDTMVYKGIMHDYFYQMRYAHITMKKSWPGMTVMDARNCRYIQFIRKDGSRDCIDLDTKNDLYGLIVSEEGKSPIQVDLTNLETQVSFYLKK